MSDDSEPRGLAQYLPWLATPGASTLCILVLVGLAFVSREGAIDDVDHLLTLGAVNDLRLQQGELWRLATAMMLSPNVVHAVLGALGLLIFGASLERRLGARTLLFVYFIIGAAAVATALVFESFIYVGPTVPVAAVFGFEAQSLWARRTQPRDPSQRTTWLEDRHATGWFLCAFMGAMLPIGPVEHLAGLVLGFALAFPFATATAGSSDRRAHLRWALPVGVLAIATWAAAHSAATSAAEAARQRGIELEESGDHVGALGEYRRAVELDPEDAANLVSLAIGLCKTGDHAGALATYERAAKLAPDNPDVLSNQALELEEGGHPDDARALMERAKALVPKGTQTEHRIDRWLAGHRVE